MSKGIALVCTAALGAGCAKNPALAPKPKPNGAALTVEGDQRLWDGNPVDEQDYYHLAGDKESEQAIRDKRAGGRTLQSAGVGVLLGGIALAAGGIVAWQLGGEDFKKPGLIVAAISLPIGLFTGRGLIKAGNHKIRGEDDDGKKVNVFDNEHAAKAVERGTFGAGGLTASAMKSIELKGPDGLCVGDDASVEAIVTDTTSAQVPADRLTDLVEWTTTLEPDPRRDSSIVIKDNSKDNLALLTQPVVVTARIVGNEQVKAQLTLSRTFDCISREELGSEGSKGKEGAPGRNAFGEGKQGDQGEDGGDGGEGSHAIAEAAWVKTPIAPKVLLIIDQRGRWALTTRKPSVDARGGHGGPGGQGGKGGDALSRSTHGDGIDCDNSGDGGHGGNGGDGGMGGLAELRYASPDIVERVSLNAPGGAGGSAGPGGDPGYDCEKRTMGRGRKGMTGREGRAGKEGKIKATKVPLAKLEMISKFLAEHPEITMADK